MMNSTALIGELQLGGLLGNQADAFNQTNAILLALD
jgi:hypothetical protein